MTLPDTVSPSLKPSMLASETSPWPSSTGPSLWALALALWDAPVVVPVADSVWPRSASVGV
jgi:hypothetical protein